VYKTIEATCSDACREKEREFRTWGQANRERGEEAKKGRKTGAWEVRGVNKENVGGEKGGG
jgi:hypothetical protein